MPDTSVKPLGLCARCPSRAGAEECNETMSPTSPLLTRPIPSADLLFTRVVEAAATDARSPEELETRLRPLFPHARVAERGLAGEPHIVYVYRDGHFTADSDEPWWEERDTASVTIDI